jgi:hypothetical protein
MWGQLASLAGSFFGNGGGSSLWGAAPGSQSEWDMFNNANFDSISNQGIQGAAGTHGMPSPSMGTLLGSMGGNQGFGGQQAMQMGMSQSKAPQMPDYANQMYQMANNIRPQEQYQDFVGELPSYFSLLRW